LGCPLIGKYLPKVLVVYFVVSILLLLSEFLFPSSNEFISSVSIALSVLLLFPIFIWYKRYHRHRELSPQIVERSKGAVVSWIFSLFALAMVVRFPSVLLFGVPYEKTPLIYLLILTIVLVEKTEISAFGLKTRGIGKALLYGIAYFAIFSFLPSLILNLLAYVSLGRLATQSYDFSSFLLVMPFMILCVGISEETLFRGYIQNGFEQFYSKRRANLFQALLFGIWHVVWYFSNPNLFYMFGYILTTFIAGLFFGYFYSKARNIVPLIVAHGLHNSFFQGFKLSQEILEIIGNLPVHSQMLMWLTPYIFSGLLTFIFIKYAVEEL